MFRNKGLFLCCIVPIISVIGVIGYGIYKNINSQKVFHNSGYILVSPESSYSDEINQQIYFEAGTKYKKVYPDKIVFKNQEGEKVVIEEDAFLHYNDGSIGSLSQGVMVDLSNLSSSVVSHYGLNDNSTMESTGNNFILDNRGSSMSFQDFVWKIKENKYLLAGKNILITLSEDNEREFSDYVEISYYDTGIIRVVSREGTWQTVSANCIAHLDNGVKLNLSNRTIVDDNNTVKLSLEQMVIGSDDNIEIVPQEVKEQVIKAPEFDIETVDGMDGTSGITGKDGEDGESGKNGEDGEEGEAGTEGEDGKAGADGEDGKTGTDGEAGNPGDPGITGTTGVNGVNGINGLNGANGASGANGAKGQEGRSGDDLANEQNPGGNGSENVNNIKLPVFEIKELNVNTTGVKAKIAVKDEENRLDPSQSFTLQIIENNTGKIAVLAVLDSSQREFDYEYNGLLPNMEYRLQIEASYVVDNTLFKRFFVNKLFITDTLGITISKAYATEKSLAINVKAMEYSKVAGADLQLTDMAGNPIRTNEISLIQAAEAEGCEVVFENLLPNTEYRVKVVNIEMSYDTSLVAPPEFREETFMTLKRSPVLGTPEVVVNKRSSCFELMLDQVVDLDGAILRYRYEIYEVGYTGQDTLVKTLYNNTNDMIPCYVDDVVIKHGYNYRVRIVAECFDNEKKIEFASAFSDIVSLTGDNFPIVLFEKDDAGTHHDKITGRILINTNGAILTVNPTNPLIIEYKSSKGDVESYQITEVPTYTLIDKTKTLYTIPFTEGNLLKADNYIISVYGTIDLNDGAGARKRSLVGSVVVKTDIPASFTAIFSQDADLTSPVSFKLGLADASAVDSSAYEASTIQTITLNLYNGDETAVTSSAPIATYTMVGTEGSNYNSTLGKSIYGTRSVTLTEADFNISASTITSNKYTVEIVSIQDYTKYGNEFIVTNNVKTFSKQATLPNLDYIDKERGLNITPITLANISQYVTDADELRSYEVFNPDIILGYEVSAAYFDNSAQLVQSFLYYVYEEANYTRMPSSQEFYLTNTAIASKEAVVSEYGGVPKAVFLFGKNEALQMSRGSKYVFTYRAKLKQTDSTGAALYFPEMVDSKVVIRSATANAPYQKPVFRFYPWSSNTNNAIWKYYINAPDTEAIASDFLITGGTLSSDSRIPKLNRYNTSTDKVELNINSLSQGAVYSVSIRTRQYKAIYKDVIDNSLISQYHDRIYDFHNSDGTAMRFEMKDDTEYNRYRIDVTVADADSMDQLSRLVCLKVGVYDTLSNLLKTITVPLENLTGTQAVAFLYYTSLEDYFSKTLYYKVTAVYDTGISGFDGATDGSARALQILPRTTRGNYITLNYTNSALFEDVSGNAKSSYFGISKVDYQLPTITMDYQSRIILSYSSKININSDESGARLQNLSGQPNITLKKLQEVSLQTTSGAEYVSYSLTSMTPTVNLNNGAALTIYTTISSARVDWILEGHGAKMDLHEIKDNKFYMELFRISATSIKEPTGRIFETEVIKGDNTYTTNINELSSNTKYGVQIYYIDSRTGARVYPINAYKPTASPASNIYYFTTSDSVVVEADPAVPVTYIANAYLDKYLQIKYGLNQTLGFDIQYSLVKKKGTNYVVMLSSKELSDRGIIRTPAVNREKMTEQFRLLPGQVYWQEGGKTVYFPFNQKDYYLCIKPVSESNPLDELGNPIYIQLDIPELNTPFYNIKTIPDNNKVTFQVSVVDIGRVMVGGHYKVKVLNSAGEDITPTAYKNVTYSITDPLSVVMDSLPANDYAVLKLYTVYDMKNTGLTEDGTILADIRDITYDNLDTAGYLKISSSGYPLSTKGYDLGTVQIAQSSVDLARVYFTNAVNLNKIRFIRYVVINGGGVNYSYSEMFSPQPASGTNSYYYELSHRFATTGVYQIQIRFYDESMNKLDDIALIYYKNY